MLPLSKWPRRLNNWDFKPPGYEHMTAQMAKISGLFPLPGSGMRSAGIIENSGNGGDGTDPAAYGATMNPNSTRQQRRIYVGNIPSGASEVWLDCGG